ncbi:hypothetical protein, partial [Enterococcus faecium]|uniref:hypothetical protein n=1 Tax=Enterococcus faecium TaxID=1352 RepID=UPI003DA091D6
MAASGINHFLNDVLTNSQDVGTDFVVTVGFWSEQASGVFRPLDCPSRAAGLIFATLDIHNGDIGISPDEC